MAYHWQWWTEQWLGLSRIRARCAACGYVREGTCTTARRIMAAHAQTEHAE